MQYRPELDGLRAVAVTIVVAFHAAPHGLFSGGFVGVDVFFVLSAFLITGVLTNNGNLGRFYWHRATRLVPALLFMLVGYLAAAPLLWVGYPHWRDALLAALYVSDYSYTFWRVPLYLQHTWSLAVEEQFYLLWPLVLLLLQRTQRPLLILGAAYFALTMWRMAFSDWQNYYYRFDTHATGLVLGAALFFAKPRLSPLSGYAAAALLAMVLFTGDIVRANAAIPFAEIAAAILIASPPSALAHPALIWLGKRSYAIYLWHFPIAYALRGILPFELTFLATVALSIGFAALSYVTVEEWGRALRDRVEARRRVEV